MSTLTAVQITDKNGRKTTVYKNLHRVGASATRAPGAPTPPRPANTKPDPKAQQRARAYNELTLHLTSGEEVGAEIDRNPLQVFRGFETTVEDVELRDGRVIVHLTSEAYHDRDSYSDKWDIIGDPNALGLDALSEVDELTDEDARRIAQEINQGATDNLPDIADSFPDGLRYMTDSIASDLAEAAVEYDDYPDYGDYVAARERMSADLATIIDIEHTTAPYDIIRADDITSAWDDREAERISAFDIFEDRWMTDREARDANEALIAANRGIRRRWTEGGVTGAFDLDGTDR